MVHADGLVYIMEFLFYFSTCGVQQMHGVIPIAYMLSAQPTYGTYERSAAHYVSI